jgi:hypothetical protein
LRLAEHSPRLRSSQSALFDVQHLVFSNEANAHQSSKCI